MVHFSQSLLPDAPLATSLPTTFTFHQNTQHDEHSILQQQQQQMLTAPSQSQLNSNQRSSSNDDGSSSQQTHSNDYETRLR